MAAKQARWTHASDILVVDDTIASLRMLTEILTKEGYKPRPVEDPELALEAALAQPPDLILLDVKMPKMSGFELCRRLKQDEHTREVPVIFVSGLDELRDRIQGFEAGGVDFITKPIQESEALARVNTHLQLRYTQLHLEDLVAKRTAELEKLLQERSAALNSAEVLLQNMFNASPLGISQTTLDGQFLTANNAMLNMLQISEEELHTQGSLNFYADPADRRLLLNELHNSGSVQDFGIQLLRSDGNIFYASVNMNLFVLEGNDVLLTMVEDVTEQILAEQQAAIMDERERLARELHDSVSQTLFSASLLADSTPTIWEKDQAFAKRNLSQISLLLRGALAEMRTLLFELRPAALRNQSLGLLIEQLADSGRVRTRATIVLNVENDRIFPEDITLTLFRIVQESLNNVAKHARATKVNIDLVCTSKGGDLHIIDNGRGFDTSDTKPGHLGLDIMAERARNIGANLEINSDPDRGTEIAVTWFDEVEGTANV